MRAHTTAFLVAGAVALAGCQGGSDDAEKAELEARIAELEEKLADTTGEDPAAEGAELSAEGAGAGEAPAVEGAAAEAPDRRGARAAADPPPVREPAPERAAAAPAPEPETPAAEPPAPAAPTPVPLALPRGTRLAVVLETPLSSKTNQVGDRVVARVAEATGPDGAIALPEATTLEGRVIEVARSGKVKGRARLVFAFDRLLAGGQERDLEATGLTLEADKDAKRDAAVVGGGAAAGAIIGAITGGKKGAGKGALIGSAAGAGAVLLTRGDEVELPAGYGFTSELLTDVRP